jgi:hypothetical protein
MEKSILITCVVLTTLGMSAFDYTNRQYGPHMSVDLSCSTEIQEESITESVIPAEKELNLYYDIDNRWRTTITKTELAKVKHIQDVIQDEYLYLRKDYRNVRIDVLHNDTDVRDVLTSEVGQSATFSNAQLALLHNLTYSTNFRITALNTRTKLETGDVQSDSLIYYITVVPEKQANYQGGPEAIIEYMKKGIKASTSIIEMDKLQSAKFFFTVNQDGSISNVKLVDTSGYPDIDEKLLRLVMEMPNRWTPAENEAGEKVAQEFVFSFGLEGC